MKPNEDYVLDQKEAIERVREIDGKISEAFEKSGRRNTEEITRLKQLTGLAELFKNQDFGKSWEPGEMEER